MDENPIVDNVETKKLTDNYEATNGTIEDPPEAILEHILSFLPIKDAIRTSILSKKWQYLWTSFPELVFDELCFSSRNLFMTSVERVLLLHHTPVKKIYLRCNVLHSASRINIWVSNVVKQNVQDCSIILWDVSEGFMLPHRLFSCKILTHLCPKMQCTLRLPSRIYLPSLKCLILGNVTFSDANSIHQLFSSPTLLELYIDNCCWVHVRTVSISAPKLKTLSIRDSSVKKDACCQVVIHGCNLHSFDISGQILNDYIISNSSVELAGINVVCYDKGTSRQLAHRLSKILHGIHAVQRLSLCGEAIYLIEAGSGSTSLDIGFPVFHNMKYLRLGDMLGKILQHTPHLQSLFLAQGLTGSHGEENDHMLDPMPPCLISSLKKIKIRSFFNNGRLIAVKNLLRCAVFVKQLEIEICYVQRINMGEVDLQLQLLHDARGLNNCKITFIGSGEHALLDKAYQF